MLSRTASLLGRATAASLLLLAGACSSLSVDPARVVTTTKSRSFAWTSVAGGDSVLVEVHPHSLDVIEELDRGSFVEILGPYETPSGIAWARHEAKGDWKVSELGVAGKAMRRSAGRGNALAALWHLERVIAGHAPGDGADLALIQPFARGGAWPR